MHVQINIIIKLSSNHQMKYNISQKLKQSSAQPNKYHYKHIHTKVQSKKKRHEKYAEQGPQGDFLNRQLHGRSICVQCASSMQHLS